MKFLEHVISNRFILRIINFAQSHFENFSLGCEYCGIDISYVVQMLYIR